MDADVSTTELIIKMLSSKLNVALVLTDEFPWRTFQSHLIFLPNTLPNGANWIPGGLAPIPSFLETAEENSEQDFPAILIHVVET